MPQSAAAAFQNKTCTCSTNQGRVGRNLHVVFMVQGLVMHVCTCDACNVMNAVRDFDTANVLLCANRHMQSVCMTSQNTDQTPSYTSSHCARPLLTHKSILVVMKGGSTTSEMK